MVTRFAPSPTGYLHLGHAYSAMRAWDLARRESGEVKLRIEDIDSGRCKPEFDAAILEDLAWLGLKWSGPVTRQSERAALYQDAMRGITGLGVCYPCGCARSDIRQALQAPQESGIAKPPSPGVYPGLCRKRPLSDMKPGDALRIDMRKAVELLGGPSETQSRRYMENGPKHHGEHRLSADTLIHQIGDTVLGRKDIGISYHLAVVVDDASQGITDIVRGEDLWESTMIHRLLQELLKLPVPEYHHHPLVRDESGKRLAKRDGSKFIRAYRDQGKTPEDLRRLAESLTGS